MSRERVECPCCMGDGYGPAFVSRTDGDCGFEPALRCSRCKGDGKVPAEMVGWIADGRRLRDERVASGKSLRERAHELRISVVHLSDIEMGRTPAPGGSE